MAEKKTTKKARTSAKKTAAAGKKNQGFSAEEKAAARERVRELKAEARRGIGQGGGGEGPPCARSPR